MQYKTNIKLVIDKRKLETLLRLNCPKEILTDLIFEGKLTLTGDSLIDDNLESLMEIKEFNNWGGGREGAGRPKKIQVKNQVKNQDENQLEKDLIFFKCNQLADKDIDKDKDKDKDIDKDTIQVKSKKPNKNTYMPEFETFFSSYPKKEDKKKAYEAFKRALKEGATLSTLLEGVNRYKEFLDSNNTEVQYIKYPATWLNGRCWENEYRKAPTVADFAARIMARRAQREKEQQERELRENEQK